jgi:mannosyltransferase OCH1-like enzyme
MKRRFKKIALIIFLIMISVVGIIFYRKKTIIPVIDFDESMQKERYGQVIDNNWGRPVYEILKNQYEKYKNNQPTSHLKIPKIIHQIWLGSPFPEKYKNFQQSWIRYHPDWEYKLWTEKELTILPMKNRRLYEKSINYGEKSDIARYEILYQFGGLYVDTDYECLKSLETFHYTYDFYIGIQPLDTDIVQLGIGLIGTAAHHPLIKTALDNVEKQLQKSLQIIVRTGPIYFTQIFCTFAPKFSDTLALPASYFYPRGYTQSIDDKNIWQKRVSFAVHHWAGSWLKKEGFVHAKNN